MNNLGAHLVYQPKDPSKRIKGIVAVIALHILMLWAIVSGTARNALVMLKKPLEAVVIQEVIIPPPPPPLPKEIKPPEPLTPQSDAPPPPFVPPPDVAPATTSGVSIASTATPPPTPAVIAPPVQQAPVAPPGPKRSAIATACPTQVAPEMPQKALQDGIEGVVQAQITLKAGVVQDVTFLSGPRIFYPAVRAAIMQYKCISEGGEVVATQNFNFKIE